MATVAIVKKTFTDPDNGQITPYERLSIAGYVEGEYQALELKLSKTEMLLAKIILSSNDEGLEVNSRRATENEAEAFLQGNNGRNSDKINLEEEDE